MLSSEIWSNDSPVEIRHILPLNYFYVISRDFHSTLTSSNQKISKDDTVGMIIKAKGPNKSF